jgi:hypothetical protein
MVGNNNVWACLSKMVRSHFPRYLDMVKLAVWEAFEVEETAAYAQQAEREGVGRWRSQYMLKWQGRRRTRLRRQQRW